MNIIAKMLQPHNIIFRFKYTSDNFNINVSLYDEKSEFDSILVEKWDEAQKKGIFKYVLNIGEHKFLPGKYAFLAQLNPDRGEKRRKPENIQSMSKPFDSNMFNFTKLLDEEILFDIGNGDGSDVVAINNSPIEHCHSLIITERFKCLSQKVTIYGLRKAIDLLLLSKSPYLRLIFNSLCAHASVNHLHWHLYYLRYQMPLEYIKVDRLKGPIFMLTDFPSKGFCLKLSECSDRNVDELISWAYSIIDYFQTNHVAHNIYVTRAKEEWDSIIYNDIRIYIWVRTSSAGVKSTIDFIPAVCELSGHISVKSKEEYEALTESTVAEMLNDITSDTFHDMRKRLLTMKFSKDGIMID